MIIHGILETTSLSEIVRVAVLKFKESNEFIANFLPKIVVSGTRFIDILYNVPRIATAKFDLERYQRTKPTESLLENLEGKVVVDKPKFSVILKDQSTKFSSKFMPSAQESDLIDFVQTQKVLTKPRSVGAHYLNLFDHLHNCLSVELMCLRNEEGKQCYQKTSNLHLCRWFTACSASSSPLRNSSPYFHVNRYPLPNY
ncbi:hypothetical protein COOONC_00726 [Cooperia oncophora]